MSIAADTTTLARQVLVTKTAQRPWTGRLLRRSGSWSLGLTLPLLLPLAILGAWQSASTWHWISPQILPAPAVVWGTLVDLTASGDITTNLGISALRVLYGFLIGGIAGLVLGLAMGLSPTVRAYLYPTFNAISLVPALGWIPLLMMFVGIGETLKIIIIAKATLVPIAIAAVQGIRNIPENYFEVGSVFRFSRWQVVRYIVLPAAVPSLFNGVRQGLNHAWLALVVVELLASSEGIGYLMVWGRQLFQLDVVIATMIVIGAVGLLLDQGLQFAESRLLRWRRSAY